MGGIYNRQLGLLDGVHVNNAGQDPDSSLQRRCSNNGVHRCQVRRWYDTCKRAGWPTSYKL